MKKLMTGFIMCFFCLITVFAQSKNYSPPAEGLVLWLDAGDPVSLEMDSHGKISKWKDKSGSGRDAVAESDKRKPQYNSGGIMFDGKNTGLTVPGIDKNKLTATIFVVFKQPQASAVGWPRLFAASDGIDKKEWVTGINVTPYHAGAKDSGKNVCEISVASGIFKDKWAKDIKIGCSSSPAYIAHFGGYIFEVIAYARVLDNCEITAIWTALEGKWKIAGSAVSNPAASTNTATVTKAKYREGPPTGKNWKLVWNDEFEGTALDAAKWIILPDNGWIWPGIKTKYSKENLFLDGKGSLVLQLTKDNDGTVRYNNGIRSTTAKACGYFEARVQLSSQPGWWTAVWLGGNPNLNVVDTFLGSQEFDIFEDFYKPKKANDISQTYHCSTMLELGSDTYRTKKLPMIDTTALNRVSLGTTSNGISSAILEEYSGWHTVGLQWTPLEHIFYVDGQETYRHNYKNVPVTNVPSYFMITGQYLTPNDANYQPFYGRLESAKFPDRLVVDYFRVYEEDLCGNKLPVVSLSLQGVAQKGKPVAFEVKANSQNSQINSVMLFSMGRLRAEQTVNSASETVTFSINNLFDDQENTVIAMTKDKNGLIGQSAPLTVVLLRGNENNTKPYAGSYQQIPGNIMVGNYDDGGQGIAYLDATPGNRFKGEFRQHEDVDAGGKDNIGSIFPGEWVKYSVDVKESAHYMVSARVGRPAQNKSPSVISIFVDGKPLTRIFWDTCTTSWTEYETVAAEKPVELNKGKHIIKVVFTAGTYNLGGLRFDKQ